MKNKAVTPMTPFKITLQKSMKETKVIYNRGPRGSLEAVYFPVSIPNPRGLYEIKQIPRESHMAFSSI